MRTKAIALLLVLFALCPGSFAQGSPEKEKAARDAAQKWLSLVDSGKYAESWESAASLFRGAVPKESWNGAIKGVRAPLGAVSSRAEASCTYATTLPGAPDGEYVVFIFKTAFANKKNATETVTPMLDNDGKWRVSGYYVK